MRVPLLSGRFDSNVSRYAGLWATGCYFSAPLGVVPDRRVGGLGNWRRSAARSHIPAVKSANFLGLCPPRTAEWMAGGTIKKRRSTCSRQSENWLLGNRCFARHPLGRPCATPAGCNRARVVCDPRRLGSHLIVACGQRRLSVGSAVRTHSRSLLHATRNRRRLNFDLCLSSRSPQRPRLIEAPFGRRQAAKVRVQSGRNRRRMSQRTSEARDGTVEPTDNPRCIDHLDEMVQIPHRGSLDRYQCPRAFCENEAFR